ncbi:hypothetical protein ABW19_dt0206795 [Dactylella cylindrospora]|nr:hypothetical protein ABW19_dt0206795 [Dactylella cylindrospora]
MANAFPTLKGQNTNWKGGNDSANTASKATDSIPTIEIKLNSSISSKVRQCLAILQVPSNIDESKPAALADKAARKSKIVALKAVHPSAGSKTITVAEIVKRCIAEGDGKGGKGTWWQYTKLESQLIEWPPKKYKKEEEPRKEEEEKEVEVAAQNANKRKQHVVEERAAKRPKLDSTQRDTGAQRSAHVGETPAAWATSSQPTQKPIPKRLDTTGNVEDGQDEMETDEIPQQLRDSTPVRHTTTLPPSSASSMGKPTHLASSSPGPMSEDRPSHLLPSSPGPSSIVGPAHLRSPSQASDSTEKPAHLRYSSPGMSSVGNPAHLRDNSPTLSSDKPVHLREYSPALSSDIPVHLRDSSPEPQSDDKPEYLLDSSPTTPKAPARVNPQTYSSSASKPDHLASSSPFKPLEVTPTVNRRVSGRPASSSPITARQAATPVKSKDIHHLTSSPPAIPHAHVESDDESPVSPEDLEVEEEEIVDEDDAEESEDEYRQFSYLNVENLPEKHTKRLLAELDAAERNRKKYRAIAIMTIYLSLGKRGDLEKLYGGQTNFGETK